jgi:uncharacterized membrane protein/mono/diheme cytochrome c family protein
VWTCTKVKVISTETRRRGSEVGQAVPKAFVLSLVLLAVCALGAENGQLVATPSISTRPTDSPQALADQVHTIFAVKCVECHGADLGRPKGKFGYVLDLARVAANPKMIVRGNPKKSELYQMLVYNEMPGKGNTKGPLTPEQKDVVKRWIEAGAPEPIANESVLAEQPLTLSRRIVRDIGQFHPLTTHFPIALLMVALPAELMWTLTQNSSWKATVRFCVMFGAAGAVVTAALGWCDAVFSTQTGTAAQVLLWHRWSGTATAVWAVIAATLSEVATKRGNPRCLLYGFRFTLAIGAVLVGVAGYLGASLIYGLNHFLW